MIDHGKTKAIRDYLLTEFPGSSIEEKYDHERISQTFRIDCANISYLLTVSREFLDDHSSPEISKLLERYELSDSLEAAGESRLILTNQGLRIEGDTKIRNLTTEKMIRHLEDKWKGCPCPMCKGKDWDIASIYELRQNVAEGFDTNASVIPVIPIICRNCGNTILVNAIVAEIIQAKQKD